ncbi:serine hydrolase domain-containing protein [Neptunicoccus cionae]|uniref:serine hydrolase domain-containing protein n=1 Tax=Neptunicoccus cionae TaxID=2035344 RepID=UPI000C7643A3|nr:serine hydrolase [Amylibacter cionae]PLS22292.1 6-aminohexanoate hydrolase [Amylibacter cionae]
MPDYARYADTARILGRLLLRGDVHGIRRVARTGSLFAPQNIVANFGNMQALFFHQDAKVTPQAPSPLPEAPRPIAQSFTHKGRRIDLNTWHQERNITAMVVLKNGAVVHEEYLNGTTAQDRRISWSMCKSILSATFGVMVDRGMMPDLDTKIGSLVPDLQNSAYAQASIRNVLNMASGVAFNEDYLDYHSDINRMGRLLAVGGSMDAFAAGLTQQQYAPGTYNNYVSIDTHVIGMVMRAVSGKGTNALVSELLFQPMGLEQTPYFLTDSLGEPFVLGGLNMTTRDYARFGQMFAQAGQLNGKQIVSPEWVKASTAQSAPPPTPETAITPQGAQGYGYQWWRPAQAADGEFYAIGIYGQYIFVDTARQVVIAVNAGDTNFRDGDGAVTQSNLAVFRQIAASLE